MVDAQVPWTVARLLQATQAFFAGRGIDSARLDAELLLCHVLGRDRVYLYTHYDQPVSDAERAALRELVKRRGAHAPVAYLLGQQEFYGIALEVGPDVLIPRPETEHVVEAALAWLRRSAIAAPCIVDVGCGSGAIAIALALSLPDAQIWATDLSAAALAVAGRNVAKHGLGERVHLAQGDLLAAPALPPSFDVIVSNPPYVPAGERLPRTVAAYEPHEALFAGPDGLDVLRRLLPQVRERLRTPGFVALEYAPEQTPALQALLAPGLAGTGVLPDLAGHNRVAIAWRGPDRRIDLAGPFEPDSAPPKASQDAVSDAPREADFHVQLDAPDLARD